MEARNNPEHDKGGYRQINKALNICAFDDYLKGQTASLPALPDVEQVTPRVLRVLGQNPGKFTFQGTNTFVVGTAESRILIDTSGGEPEYILLLAQALKARNIRVKYVLITHWHGDHCGGVADLIQMYPHLKDHIYKNDPEPGQQNIADGQVFRVEGATVTAVHAPGHSKDHMCFRLEEESSMFTGDNILGHGTSAVEDLGVYMSSLGKMAAQNPVTGHPGHGVTIDNLPAKIERELSQKLRRETQILAALKLSQERGQRSVSVKELVAAAYGASVDETTRILALEPFTEEVLRKVASDGKVGFEVRGCQKRWYLLQKQTDGQRTRVVRAAAPRILGHT
ncbi:hypothetical protein V2A60_008418 [Cordyceps javanica]|uniref:Beta lactamase domain n=1 Tax=Cordyceps javanica TaxID=43265 RepID=A0A545UNB8_9HYPO|nr:beta lactamase domain [Cordyceps javanica]TQW02706.1 beta lactamase domain [Cordyceps javanica]